MPRDMLLSLETLGKSRHGYKATIETAHFLKQAGWTVMKNTRTYKYLQPPPQQPGGKSLVIKVEAPTDDEIVAAANEMHAAAIPFQKMLFGWPMSYLPTHTKSQTVTEVDPFTAVQGKSETTQNTESAVCRIGFILIWQAEIRWSKDGKPILHKYAQREVQAKELLLDTQPAQAEKLQYPITNRAAYVEGAVEGTVLNIYERDLSARRACIEHFGASCQVCGLNFGERYGAIGKGFIHVHHLTPLSTIRQQYQVDPVKDLRPVCPNCHAMLHRMSPPLSINELKSRLTG